jgi:hypothetical protein
LQPGKIRVGQSLLDGFKTGGTFRVFRPGVVLQKDGMRKIKCRHGTIQA